jgi:uncharacterized protein (TIGR03086 family)
MLGQGGMAVLLEQAITYSRESLGGVTPGLFSVRTPCSMWDLRALLAHVNESLAALVEGTEIGHIGLRPVGIDIGNECLAGDPVAEFHEHTDRLLRGCAGPGSTRMVSIADRFLPADLMAITGAIEIAVHGWDISVSCGERRPIPTALADGILSLSPMVIDDGLRPSLFAAPVAIAPSASSSDRLVAFFGRDPRS